MGGITGWQIICVQVKRVGASTDPCGRPFSAPAMNFTHVHHESHYTTFLTRGLTDTDRPTFILILPKYCQIMEHTNKYSPSYSFNITTPNTYITPPYTTTILGLTRFNKIAIQGTPQMAVDKEAICLSRVYSYYPKCNFPLFYV